MPQLVLASTSPFRRELLQKLQLAFTTDSPDIDESRRDGETPEQLVARLAKETLARKKHLTAGKNSDLTSSA